MLKSNKISVLFTRLNVNGHDLIDKLSSQLGALPATLKREADLRLSNQVKEVLMRGFTDAYEQKEDNTTVLNLLLPCVQSNPILTEILIDLKIDENKLKIPWPGSALTPSRWRIFNYIKNYLSSSRKQIWIALTRLWPRRY